MKNILEYLETSTAAFPDKTAVIDGSGSCSYKTLTERCQRIGSVLAEKIGRGAPVAVFMEKGIDALCAFWGITYAGGFYVLLNTEFPKKRLGQIQDVLQADYVITDRSHAAELKDIFPARSILMIDRLEQGAIDSEKLAQIRRHMIDTDPLYANFTSGSTGVPKGVIISHRSVIDFINVFTDVFGFDNRDIFANQAPFDFDVSVKDIYTAMKTGGTLVIVPKYLFSQPTGLLDFLCSHRVTVMIWAVSALCLITTFHGLSYKTPDTVRKILFSGEVMPIKHLNTWMRHLPGTQFVNLYGPTEITCNCTYHIIDRGRTYDDGLPIGYAFDNEHVFLLDDNDQEITAPGTAGEICVRGTALALGYCRMPAQNAAAFVQNPLNTRFPELIYRTGDLGRYNDDGELFFCGRKDFQIKHMGHRIELEEIERTLSGLPGIERCCCVFDEPKQKLYGFYIGSADKTSVYEQLRLLLPVYMIPGALQPVDCFPLTKNGKTDRKQLLERRYAR